MCDNIFSSLVVLFVLVDLIIFGVIGIKILVDKMKLVK